MSVLQEILEDLAEYITSSPEYNSLKVYYDDSMMDPNISLPAISFQVGETEESKSGCGEYIKELDIRLHTRTLDKSALIRELWDFEEQIIKIMKKGNMDGTLSPRNELELTYKKTLPLRALVYNPPGTDKEVFFSNLLSVSFQFRYTI
jgi:hypothetical protein